jgi:transposase
MAYLRGEPKVWSVVRVPTIAEEDDRRLHRERDRLINERVQHVNRIKGLYAVHGIYHYEPLRSDRMKRLEQLRTGDERQLPPVSAEIRRELQRLELALQMIKAIEKERNVMAQGKTPSTYGNAKKVQQLVKIGSIGPEIATVLVGEVFYRQFNNRQQVGSYVGLTPSHFQSGLEPPSRSKARPAPAHAEHQQPYVCHAFGGNCDAYPLQGGSEGIRGRVDHDRRQAG